MGIDVTADPMSVKQRIAVVPQQSNLDRSLRAREILTFHASYHGISRSERNARADEILKELGLGDRGKDKVGRYSGGMAQRLMLARALMHSPDVLFLDEPTNSLDPQSRLFLWERIRTLYQQGVTALLTTHNIEEADQLCERIAIMDHGKILVLDTPDQLKKIIPGGTRVELRLRIPELVTSGTGALPRESTVKTQLLDTLRAMPGVVKVDEVAADDEQDGQQGITLFRLYAEDANALVMQATQAAVEAHVELRDLHIARPNLEDVFIYLTSKSLRDADGAHIPQFAFTFLAKSPEKRMNKVEIIYNSAI
jgi:ABC-2 type transport system ATP-binding protein